MNTTRILPFAALTFFGCGTGETVQIASVHVKTQLIVAATGGHVDVSAAEHQRLAGFRLDVPANALERDTKITVGFTTDSLADSETDASGPTVELGPDGTQFSSPVSITIPYDGDLDEDLLRVFVVESNGTRAVVLPDAITYDASTKTVTFAVSHFTRFQGGRGRGRCANVMCPSGMCRRGQCIPATDCSAQDACGPALGAPVLMCNDGSIGGNTGRCLPDGRNSCAWELRDCPADCSPMECGPAPGAPNFVCADGSIGGPSPCHRLADGMCGYEIIACPTPIQCMSDRECGMGQCVNGVCSNTPPPPACTAQECGPQPGVPNVMCSDGMTIGGPTACYRHADGSCGYDIIQCPPSACQSDRDCGANAACQNGQCVPNQPNQCGPMNPCPRGETCEPNRGVCIPAATSCMSDRDCVQGQQTCDPATAQCVSIPPQGCMSDRECGIGNACVNGQCAPVTTRCMSDRDCVQGQQICDAMTNQCVPISTPGCRSDRDCVAGQQYCDAATAQCVSIPPPVRCMSDRDCAMGESCDLNTAQCVPSQAQCTVMECGPAPGLPNYLCPDGVTTAGPTDCRRLADGSCGYEIISCPVRRCMSDRDCGANQTCNPNNVCQ